MRRISSRARCHTVKNAPQSGRRPSASTMPYSGASPYEAKHRPVLASTAGSAASAAMARPTKKGVSEAAKSG